jgi:hypothetical protein
LRGGGGDIGRCHLREKYEKGTGKRKEEARNGKIEVKKGK